MYAALRSFLKPGALEERLRHMLRMSERITKALDASGGFKTTMLYPGPTGQTYRWIGAEVLHGVPARALHDRLMENGIILNALNLEMDEVEPLIEGILTQYQLLREGGAGA